MGVVYIPGGESLTEYSMCHSLSKINVCCPWMSLIAEEIKPNCS